MSYEDHNQVDYTLRIGSVSGVAKDIQGFEVRGACVGIFTQDGGKLVATEDAANGHFEIDGLPNGRYRLVVSAQGLCAANAIIISQKQISKEEKFGVVMKPRGIDDCSSIELR